MKKSNQEKQYSEKLQRWKQDKKQETSAKWSKINGQNYVDMSDGTIIMDNKEPFRSPDNDLVISKLRRVDGSISMVV